MPRAQAARTRAQRPRSVRAVGASAPIRGPIPAALPRSALLHRSVAPIPAALPRSAFLGTTFALGDRTRRRPTPGARLPSCSSCMAGTACRVGPASRGTVRRSWRRPEVVSCSIDHAPVHGRGGMRRAERASRPRSRPRVRGMQFPAGTATSGDGCARWRAPGAGSEMSGRPDLDGRRDDGAAHAGGQPRSGARAAPPAGWTTRAPPPTAQRGFPGHSNSGSCSPWRSISGSRPR